MKIIKDFISGIAMSEEKDFVKKLLKALENDKVIEKLKESISSASEEQNNYSVESIDRSEELQRSIDSLTNLNKKLSAENDELKNQVKSLDRENDKLASERDALYSQKLKIEAECKMYRDSAKQATEELKIAKDAVSPFANLARIISVCENLPSKTKTSLKNLIGKGSPEEIIACGLRQSCLQSFWETARLSAMDKEFDIAQGLGEIFEYLVETYEKINRSAEMLDVKVGVAFDDKKHIHCEGKTRVKVTEVLVKGLVVNGDVLLKAIVR